ncbi:MAG: hypothetical protein AAGI48_03280 [Verrucomicrobiota bacterium]
MKTHALTELPKDAWQEIDFIFWRNEVPCLPSGSSGDGFLPENIETTKRGVEIDGTMTFLGGSRGYFEHPMVLCLGRPRFSSIESVTQAKLRSASISEAEIDDGTLYITVV